jgi:hypothetical protein
MTLNDAIKEVMPIERSATIRNEKENEPDEIDFVEENEGADILASVEMKCLKIVCAEQKGAEYPYVVYHYEYGDPFRAEEQRDHARFPDYVSAMREFMARGQETLTALETERESRRLPHRVMTAADCIPDGADSGLVGKLVIICPEALMHEFRSSDYQLKIVLGGFGAQPNARGNAIFCEDLYTGEKSRFERQEVLGVADPEKLPDWAFKKLALREALMELGVFEYGGYHFKPKRQFRKGEVDKHLEGDSRPEKMDISYAMRNMRFGNELGLREQNSNWSYEAFYAAANGSTADIFKCVENGKLFVPCASALCEYDEPPQRNKAQKKSADKEPSIVDRLNNARAAAEKYNEGHGVQDIGKADKGAAKEGR